MKSLNFGVNYYICGFILLLFLLLAVFLFHIQCYLLAVIFIIGVLMGIHCIMHTQDELIKITNKNKIISFYIYENKKQKINQYKFEDIEDFHITITQIHENNYSRTPAPIELTFIVKRLDELPNVYKTNVHGHFSIKQIFEFAKNIPNFSYNVETNRDVTLLNIENIAKTGKSLSLREALNIVENDSKVPVEVKSTSNLLVIYIIVSLCIVIPMIISIIIDIIKDLQY